jgi:hypothetical protein
MVGIHFGVALGNSLQRTVKYSNNSRTVNVLSALTVFLKIVSGIVFTLFSLIAFSQESKVIYGNIRSSKDNIPIAFANIYNRASNIGTVSNENGDFKLSIQDIPNADSLTISFIGYKSIKISLSQIKKITSDTLKIHLEELPTVLKSIDVIGLTPYGFLRASSIKTSQNLIQPALLACYYREFQSKNGVCVKFADALVDYYLDYKRGYKTEVITRVTESRAKNRKFKTEAKSLGDIRVPKPIDLEILPQFFDAERKFSVIFKDGLDYNFEIFESADQIEGSFFKIKFTPKSTSKKVLYEGEFLIDKETSIIHSATYALAESHVQFGEIKNVLGIKFQVSSLSVYIQFQTLDKKCHLKYVKATVGVRVHNKKDYDVINLFRSEMLVNKVVNEINMPFKKLEIYGKDDIYKKGNNYKTNFWEGQRGLISDEKENSIIQSFDDPAILVIKNR